MHSSNILEKILRMGKRIIPKKLFKKLQPAYHYVIALAGAVRHQFPSRHIKVIAITGTKGKTSTAEIMNAILEAAGYTTALAGTLRFKIGDRSWNNMFKMTIPGRSFLHKFLHDAVRAGCEYAVIEMTSEGAKQFRHKWIDFNALIVTNISPEHIESHGSYEKYLEAKLSIAHALADSPKTGRAIVVNSDDKEAHRFLAIDVPTKLTYSLKDAEGHRSSPDGVVFTYKGGEIHSNLPGIFNIQNLLAAITYAHHLGISMEIIESAVKNLSIIRGRVERIKVADTSLAHKQHFNIIVDYAHTSDSLEKVYKVFEGSRIIGVLGGTGGGRDTWKRSEMGRIADKYCATIILTNEDPYDENPDKIVQDIATGIAHHKSHIIMDRRLAIRDAIEHAEPGDIIVITGKGTDPYIMGPHGLKIPWSDAAIAREELEKFLQSKN